ncbi:glycine--tRNA ligase [Bernardetia sp.]|uniref:glycine--tRNA ligase n=1 Tax=Bernardetia sp. TaxID=1937974 RepID=UPI0025C552C6|nr:glycine--tRNA ligase [Bernardetia sp.]
MESTKTKKKKQKGSPENELFQKIISHCKEYGFVFQSSEIYDGLQAVYDYGQNGSALRNNLQRAWWLAMTRLNDNIVGIDAAIFMHPTTWHASGHVEGFNDPMIDNKDSQKRYRADQLIENRAEQYEKEGDKEKGQALVDKMNDFLKKEDLEGVRNLIIEENIVCEISGTANWTEVRQFNLMFSTQIGSVDADSNEIYLRPETAQGIFVNYLNVQKTSRLAPPFGIAQIGKAFRNEIVARQFIMRMREFTQMEMQFFIKPGTQKQWFEKWKENRHKWHLAIGTPAEKLRFHVHDKLAHYADAAEDIEFNYPIGWKEMEGIHSRTDFDLKQHEEYSKKKLRFHDPQAKENYIPYVIETSIGLDRLFLSVMSNAYQEIESTNDKGQTEKRIVLSFPAPLAPTKVAVFPLTKKDGLPEKAKEILKDLNLDLETFYEESASIGKRYARQDVVGTPFCVTVDHDTLEDNTVTLRYRDTTEQIRIPISELKAKLVYECSMSRILEKLV